MMMDALSSLELGWGRRMPMVLQAEAAECGLACIAMVLAHHGTRIELTELRRRFGMSLRGATLKNLVNVANALSLEPRPLRLELDELAHLSTPCILHWDLHHFVVLREVTASGAVLHDPAVGVRRLGLDELSKHFTGVALELTPTAGMQDVQPSPRIRMRALLGKLIGLPGSLARVFAVAFAIEVLTALAPLYMQWVMDDALVTADRELLTTLFIGFALLLAFRVAFDAIRGWMLLAIGAALRVQARANLFAHLVELPAAFFEARQLGDVLSRFGSQETILQALTTDLVEAVLDGILAIFTLALMMVFAPGLAAIVLVGAALYAVLRWAAYTPLRHASVEAIAWAARRDTHFLETLRGMKTIKLFDAQDERRRGWLNLLVETTNRQLTTQKLQIVFRTSNGLLAGMISLLVVWLGARRVLDHGFTAGALVAFIAYKEQFLTRVSALVNKGLDLYMLELHGERLADIVLTEPEPRDRADVDAHGANEVVVRSCMPPALAVEGLRYRYSESDPWVLDGIDLTIEPGESVAIVGASGCGKTTLLKVLASLLSQRDGEGVIRVDGRPLAQVGLASYRSMLGVVMQDDQLFAGSIADNICFFAESPDRAWIEECARQAAVHDAIAAMPMGYDTLIGDMGAALSGGQKQRILIARALYRRPKILLLDEATSHLDVACERAVNTAISASSITRIIVAHRPETILSADRVIVLANGRVVDEAHKGDLGLGFSLDGVRMRRALVAYRPPTESAPDVDITATTRVGAFRMPPEALPESTKPRPARKPRKKRGQTSATGEG